MEHEVRLLPAGVFVILVVTQAFLSLCGALTAWHFFEVLGSDFV